MPYLKLQTNKSLNAQKQYELAGEFSALVSKELGKPEKFIMVAVEPEVTMMFNKSVEPLVFIELKSIGLPDTRQLSARICDFVQEKLHVDKSRVYIEFSDSPPSMFGWNGGTFEK